MRSAIVLLFSLHYFLRTYFIATRLSFVPFFPSDDYAGWQKSDVQTKINWHLSCCHQHYHVYLSQLWLHDCTYICYCCYIKLRATALIILSKISIKALNKVNNIAKYGQEPTYLGLNLAPVPSVYLRLRLTTCHISQS